MTPEQYEQIFTNHINRLEKDLSILQQNQEHINQTLGKLDSNITRLLQIQTSIQLHSQRMDLMDKELTQSFKRVHTRLDILEGNVRWVVRSIIGTIIGGAIGLLFYLVRT